MKKLILILAIALIASPALAVLDVNLVKVGSTIEVRYTGANSGNLPRAFALDLTINGNGTFDSFASYKTGESTSASRGYGIYPATIDINDSSIVEDWGSPLAAAGSVGTTDQVLPSSHIVLEFGSLYTDGNGPNTSGTLCVLNFTPGTATQVVMDEEDTYRGGIVFEDGSLGDYNDVLSLATLPGAPTYTNPASNGATGISRAGIDLTWTAGAGATGHDVYFGTAATPPEVSHNQPGLTRATAAMTQGKLYYWQIVERNSVGTTAGPIWSFRVEECLKSTDTGYSYWKFLGRPSCFCFKRQCRGDGNGLIGFGKPVTAADFTNFQAGYNKATTILSNLYDSAVPPVPALCGDYNHAVGFGKPVTAADFTVFTTYYNKATTSVPLCVGTNINFWMN